MHIILADHPDYLDHLGHLVHLAHLNHLLSPVQLSTDQYSPGKPNAAQCNKVQPSATKYSPV